MGGVSPKILDSQKSQIVLRRRAGANLLTAARIPCTSSVTVRPALALMAFCRTVVAEELPGGAARIRGPIGVQEDVDPGVIVRDPTL
jgi:hypothetical protein